MTLLSPHALLWLALLPVLGALLLFRFHRRQGVLRRGAGPNARRFFAQTLTPVRAALKGLLLLLALLLLILALAEPAWGERTETIRREGRDVVFLLDLSRSMLADDLLPSRLERAKMEIAQCLETLEGDRIALVGFAGDARVFCPLTLDYGFFRMMLQEMTPDALSRGGTNLGDALRKVQRDVLDGQTALGRDVVLITDGEDQESMPVEAAKALGDAKIRLLAIGLGDDGEGTLLTLPDKRGGRAPLLYQGKPVRTRLDSQTLQAMADATPGGVYVPVGTRPFNLEEIYRQLVNTAERHQISEETVRRKNVHSTPFVLAAMVCLALFWLLPLGKRPRTPWLGLLLLLAALPLQGNDFHTGTQALQQQDYDTALAHFQKCREELSPEAIPATLPYNQGVAAYEKGDFPQAEAFFQEGMERNGLTPAPDRSLDGKLRLGLSSALLQNAAALFAQAQTPQPGDMTAQPLPAAEEKTREAINLLEDMLPENSLRKARETNLELARELLDNILAWKEQQQQQDSQRQDSQQQDSQQQDSQQQDSQQQDSQQQDSQQQDSQQQDSQQQDSQQQDSQQQDSQQQDSQQQDSQQQDSQQQESQQQESQQQDSQRQESQQQDSQQQESLQQDSQQQESQQQDSQQQDSQQQDSQQQDSQQEGLQQQDSQQQESQQQEAQQQDSRQQESQQQESQQQESQQQESQQQESQQQDSQQQEDSQQQDSQQQDSQQQDSRQQESSSPSEEEMSQVAAMQEENPEESREESSGESSRAPLVLSGEEEESEESPESHVAPLPQDLQRILDQETQRRWLRRQKTIRQRPVEKDW